MDLHGPSWTFMDLHGPSWTFMDLHGPSWTFMDLHGPSWTFMDLHGPSWTFMDLHGPSWTFTIFVDLLSQAFVTVWVFHSAPTPPRPAICGRKKTHKASRTACCCKPITVQRKRHSLGLQTNITETQADMLHENRLSRKPEWQRFCPNRHPDAQHESKWHNFLLTIFVVSLDFLTPTWAMGQVMDRNATMPSTPSPSLS